jgi:hypothetical protein
MVYDKDEQLMSKIRSGSIRRRWADDVVDKKLDSEGGEQLMS